MTTKIFDFHLHTGYDFHNDELGYEITPELFVMGLKKCGVSFAAGSTIHKADFKRPVADYKEVLPRLNRETYAFYEAYPDFFTPGIHVDPNYPTLSCEEIEKYSRLGVKLIGEIIPKNMGWSSYATKDMLEILKFASECNMVLSVHPDTNVANMETLVKSLPQMQIVIAHLDAYGLYEDSIRLMKTYENVSYDLSAYGAARDGMIADAVGRVGHERILFGTDYPGYSPEPFINAVLNAKISVDAKEAIFYKNAERLLGISIPDKS